MGGIGSGRWHLHTKKGLVEDCLVLDIRAVASHGLCLYGEHSDIQVLDSEQWIKLRLPGKSLRSARGLPVVQFDMPVGDDVVRQEIEIWPLGLDGHRGEANFLCPGCERERCRKLYLPPGSALFKCRKCHNLSYAKRQKHKVVPDDPDRLLEALQRLDSKSSFGRTIVLARKARKCMETFLEEAHPVVRFYFEFQMLEKLCKDLIATAAERESRSTTKTAEADDGFNPLLDAVEYSAYAQYLLLRPKYDAMRPFFDSLIAAANADETVSSQAAAASQAESSVPS